MKSMSGIHRWTLLMVCLAAVTACSAHPTHTDDRVAGGDGEVRPPTAPAGPSTLSAAERSRAAALARPARGRLEVAPVAELPTPSDDQVDLATTVALYPPTDAGDDRRLAAVTHFDYGRGIGTRVVVNLTTDEVVDARPVPPSSVPVTPAEEERLRELLRDASEEYRALLAAPADHFDLGTFVSTGDEPDLAGHRLVLVRPVYFQSAPTAPMALVDLTTGRILRYEE